MMLRIRLEFAASCGRHLPTRRLSTDIIATRFSNSRSKWGSFFNATLRRPIHTTNRRSAAPLIAMLLKTGGIKVLKVFSIVFGRSFRKFYPKLPDSIRSRFGKHRMFYSVVGFTFPFLGYYSYTHYESCPITGRKRWITFTKDQVVALADLDYQKLIDEHQQKLLSESHPMFRKNEEIVSKLIAGNSDIDMVKNTTWALHVIDDATVTNAFVLPNGHIFVFTGMLKMLNTWEEMAVILGHEMSHAILGHSQEQQSYLAFGELLTIPLLAFIWFMLEDFAAFLAYSIQHYVYPIVFEYGFSLPYSRLLEAEADEVGLMLSSKACYDPRWSVLLWEKMAMKEALESETVDVEEFDFLSTHPSNQKRSATLEEKLPKAMEMRSQCDCPPLSKNVDPQAAAHQMRKCIENVRKRKVLMEELKQKTTLLDKENFLQVGEVDPSIEEALQNARKESEDIKRRLHALETEYNRLASAPDLSSTRKDEPKPEEKTSIFAKVYYNIAGNVAPSGKLTNTLFEREFPDLNTVNLKNSAFGSSKGL